MAIEIRQYDVILRALWLYAVNPNCDFRRMTQSYRDDEDEAKIKVKEVSLLQMINDAGDTPIFTISVTPIKHPRFQYKKEIGLLRPNDLKLFLVNVEKLLSLKYADYTDVFFKKDVVIFFKSIRVRHAILISKETEVLYRPIYPLS